MQPKALRLLAGLLSLILFGACTASEEPDPLACDPDALAAALTQSLRARDSAGFEENFARSSSGQRLARQLFDNLTELNDVAVSVQPGGDKLKVTWSVDGSEHPSAHTIAPKLVNVGGRTLIMDLLDAENPPIWIYGRITVSNTKVGTLIASERVSDAQAKIWVARMAAAVVAIKKVKMGDLNAAWNQKLVVELPRDTREYQRLVNMDPAISSAATECEEGAVRIVVNPASLDVPDQVGEALMLHEAVHASTSSPCLDTGALWASEGLAEWVTTTAYKSVATSNRSIAETFIARHGMPESLPTDASFAGDKDDVAAAYALSQLAVQVAVDELGEEEALVMIGKLSRDKDALDAEQLSELTAWYLAELKKLAK
ncbi:MAG: hypothetical protein LBI99_11180 [Propionibacteriaceae bacterium]|jgi:hypothetical protein|nr:hypothetical protein [Propionibacteriaceae bacterium]